MPYFEWQGHRLHYRARWNRALDNELLLILPGNTASAACHEGELNHYAGRYHAVALDYLGVGRSERAAVWSDEWWREGAAQAEALRAHLGYAACRVMGTSGGAIAALWMAIDYPERVTAVVADSCVPGLPPGWVEEQVVPDRAQLTDGQQGFWHLAHGGDWEQVVDADTDLMRRFAARGGDWFGPRLCEVRCPVLLTASRDDHLLPDTLGGSLEMLAQMPAARLYLHHTGAHPLMWSQPAAFFAVADHFLATAGEPDAEPDEESDAEADPEA